MRFTSFHFFLFLGVVMLGLLALRKREHKIVWLLLGGAFFYGYWDWRPLLLIGFTSIFDFWLGLKIGAAQGKRRRQLLVLDIVVNLSILVVFKYFNFFIDSFNFTLGNLIGIENYQLRNIEIILPIGISFFVFEAMSYCIDIYRGTLQPYTNWRHFALFIFFFPRMIAGPIIRPADFLPQLEREIKLRWPNIVAGGQMFLLGMTKKIVIADHLAGPVDLVFANPHNYSPMLIWQAVIAYSIQIFCDFSGYSDMAIGTAKMLGFELPVNFNLPYIATNISDFWRRWHISLSSWLRDYLYISLGGNRKGEARTYLNLLITMALGGLWHGASWNFVLWGVWHGLGLIIVRLWQRARHARSGAALATRAPLQSQAQAALGAQNEAAAQAARAHPLLTAASWALTYLFVCVGWVFFRAQNEADALHCLRKMFGLADGGLLWISGWLCVILPVFALGHALAIGWQKRGKAPLLQLHRMGDLIVLFSWLLGLFFLSSASSSPFIYFQF